jgi:perosamine synthetase
MKLIPRLKPYLGWDELRAALTPSKGKVAQFEKAFAEKFECKEGVMFSHGRSALYSLFKGWGLADVEIISPAYTCVVVQHSIVLSGNIPVFVDCEEGGPNMSYEGIASAFTEKTRAIVVTHLFGYPMDVERVERMVREAEERYGHKIYIVQDVAHSYGAKWNGELVTRSGDAAIFGMNVSKIMTSVFGGMAISNSEETVTNVRAYRDEHFNKMGLSKSLHRLIYLMAIKFAFNSWVYGFTNWLERKGILDRFVKYYDESIITFPSDWDQLPCELEARVGLVQLKKYDGIIAKRQEASARYIEAMESNPDIQLFPHIEGSTYSHFVGMVDDREAWLEHYFKKGVQLGILIEYAVPYMKAYEKYRRGDYPIAKSYSERSINFPNWPDVPHFLD